LQDRGGFAPTTILTAATRVSVWGNQNRCRRGPSSKSCTPGRVDRRSDRCLCRFASRSEGRMSRRLAPSHAMGPHPKLHVPFMLAIELTLITTGHPRHLCKCRTPKTSLTLAPRLGALTIARHGDAGVSHRHTTLPLARMMQQRKFSHSGYARRASGFGVPLQIVRTLPRVGRTTILVRKHSTYDLAPRCFSPPTSSFERGARGRASTIATPCCIAVVNGLITCPDHNLRLSAFN